MFCFTLCIQTSPENELTCHIVIFEFCILSGCEHIEELIGRQSSSLKSLVEVIQAIFAWPFK